MSKSLTKKTRLNVVQVLSLGFALVILSGAILLSLPISSSSGEYTNFIDAIFTSTSAVCVTGLVTLDTGTYWNTFGQVVIILLIEIGGLGFMSLTTFIAILLGKKITLRDRLLIQEAMNTFNLEGLVKMVKYVFALTFTVQFFGALLLSTQFVPQFGIVKGAFYSIFHSISAFCNAGFDLFGHFNSLVGYSSNIIIIFTISALIIIGGLGFTVWLEIYNYRGSKKLSINSKMVILVTISLLVGGFLLILLFEYNNPNTLGDMSFKDKLLNSFFASVSPRTAGFNSMSTDGMTMSGKLITIILMFIGGSSGSTAGGLKTATFGILVLTVISVLKGREDTEVFERRFSKDIVYKAFTLLFIAIMIVMVATMILTVTETGQSFINLLYEATSAFGTVGLTTGVTQQLSLGGKLIIILTMYCGRVGPLTVILALLNRKKKTGYKYPEGKILIG
ncbi:TrkH family potassium uptake protein [Clostridium uliginosum]|uniref:Trk system potassium uptake protein TrkH n=1 Tax=Clostridium uliginosum TaxID=119641 RepID=A0A1I1K272_9CLOT|nr:TrkH family potassium uptake protein [Clostridium uliginosum]SFC54715.1 trk system potassium uptake protein TrkH [Clostridium uliginosum]